MDVKERVAALEAEIASLKQKPKPAEEGARILHPTARLDALPSEEQCRKLLKIVTARYEVLEMPASINRRWADNDERTFVDGFCGAVAWFDMAASRTEKLDKKFDVRTWLDECVQWCRRHNLTQPSSLREFMAAAVACGVKYSSLDRFPYDLQISVGYYGKVVRGEWRKVLQNGPAEPVPVRDAKA
jgi:hypothetical protein